MDRRHRQRVVAVLALTLATTSMDAGRAHLPMSASEPPAATRVAYHLRYTTDRPDLVHVTISFVSPLIGEHVLVMPRAIPMGYGEQPFDEFVEALTALGPSNESRSTQRDEGPRWKIGRTGEAIHRVAYDVNVRRMEELVLAASDSSRVRDGYVGLLGYSVFAYIEGQESEPALLTVEGPASWPVLSTLAPSAPPPVGVVRGAADNFYALADSQIAMGPRMTVLRAPGDTPLYVCVYAEGEVDASRIAELASGAMSRLVTYFGSAPFAHYTVHQELLQPRSPRHQYGFSMEHLDSSTYYLAHDQGVTARSTDADVARTLYNFAHHIAHAWIPKRAYGPGYYPFTWELAPLLETIWFAEGFGQYAAIVALAADMPDGSTYRTSMIERRFKSMLATTPPFIQQMSLPELSRVASTRYSQDFRTGRNVFSRGGLMAAEMDDRITTRSAGRKSLKDALRHLVAWSARERRAFEVSDLPRLFQEATGVDTSDILERWLRPAR